MNENEPGKEMFDRLIELYTDQKITIAEIAEKLQLIPPGGGGTPSVLIDKVITENGTYDAADDGADGFRSVTVDVAGAGGQIPVYESRKLYRKYETVVDGNTDITYLVTPATGDTYESQDIATDVADGNLKPTSDCRIVIYDHTPTQQELNALPENVLIVVYDPNDTPYTGIILNND
jgi:hypothetical protein